MKKASKQTVVPSTLEKYTTIADLEKSNKGPVWVLNNLSQKAKGVVIIAVAKRNGNGQDPVKIPHTFIPIDLTMQVGKSQLLESADFRQAVAKKLIRLITPEYATTLLSTPEGMAEAQIVADNMRRAKIAIESEVLSSLVKEDDEEDSDDSDEEEDTPAVAKAKAKNLTDKQKKVASAVQKNKTDRSEDTPGVDLKFKRMIEECVTERIPQIEIIGNLKRYKQLTRPQIKYAHKFFKDMPRVARFLVEAKEKVKAE